MSSKLHIGFDGPIAVGKTTLATALAQRFGGHLVLEEFEGNEFLRDFYADRNRWSLPMQLWFLAARHDQLASLRAPISGLTVVDYTQFKNSIFGRTLLHGRELRLYERLSAQLGSSTSPPDLIVHLDAKNETLLERIRLRGRPYEQQIREPYLNSLREAYDEELRKDHRLRILRYDTSTLDLESHAQMEALYEKILNAARLDPES